MGSILQFYHFPSLCVHFFVLFCFDLVQFGLFFGINAEHTWGREEPPFLSITTYAASAFCGAGHQGDRCPDEALSWVCVTGNGATRRSSGTWPQGQPLTTVFEVLFPSLHRSVSQGDWVSGHLAGVKLLGQRTWGYKCRRSFSAFTERFSLNELYFIITLVDV